MQENLTHQVAAILQRRYCSPEHSQLKRLLYDETFPLNESFINLALVKEEEQKPKDQAMRTEANVFRDELLQTFETIHQPKESIELRDIFTQQKDNKSSTQHLLIEGRAGVGKSTLCQYIANQWAEEQGALASWRRRFTWVIWIPLRELTEDNSLDFAQFTLAHYIHNKYLTRKERRQITVATLTEKIDELIEQKQILLLLDGYDEITEWLNSHKPHKEFFEEELLACSYWLLTSRPYYISKSTLQADRQLEVIGFVSEDIPHYVQQFFKGIEAKEQESQTAKEKSLLQFLQSNPSVWGMSHIPINLELLCSVWEEEREISKQNLTLTQLYNQLALHIFKRYLNKSSKDTIKNLFWHDLENNESLHRRSMLAFLELLAWQGMQQNSLILSGKNIIELAESLYPADPQQRERLGEAVLKELGLLKGVGIARNSVLAQDYYFVHLTFQEYWAARYIVSCWKKNSSPQGYQNIKDFIATKKFDPRYEIVWWIVAGLLKIEPEKLANFFSWLEEEPKDLTGLNLAFLQLRCFEECQGSLDKKGKDIVVDRLKRWIEAEITCTNNYGWHFFADFLIFTPNILNDDAIQALLKCYLNHKSKALGVVKILEKQAVWSPALLNYLLNLLNHSDLPIQLSIVKILVKSSAQNDWRDELLLKRLFNEFGASIRHFTLQALIEPARQKNLPEKLVYELLQPQFLNDPDKDVQFFILQILEGANYTKLIIDQEEVLLRLLNDPEQEIRFITVLTLGKLMEQKVWPQELLQKVSNLRRDPERLVRLAAEYIMDIFNIASILKNNAMELPDTLNVEEDLVKRAEEKGLLKELIQQAISILSNNSDEVIKFDAMKVLAKLVEEKFQPEAQNIISNFSINEIRSTAGKILVRLAEAKKLPEEYLQTVLSLLEKSNEEIRAYTVEILIEQIEENGLSEEHLLKILSILEKDNEEIISDVAKVLVKQAEENGLSETIIQKIISLVNTNLEYDAVYILTRLKMLPKIVLEIFEEKVSSIFIGVPDIINSISLEALMSYLKDQLNKNLFFPFPRLLLMVCLKQKLPLYFVDNELFTGQRSQGIFTSAQKRQFINSFHQAFYEITGMLPELSTQEYGSFRNYLMSQMLSQSHTLFQWANGQAPINELNKQGYIEIINAIFSYSLAAQFLDKELQTEIIKHAAERKPLTFQGRKLDFLHFGISSQHPVSASESHEHKGIEPLPEQPPLKGAVAMLESNTNVQVPAAEKQLSLLDKASIANKTPVELYRYLSNQGYTWRHLLNTHVFDLNLTAEIRKTTEAIVKELITKRDSLDKELYLAAVQCLLGDYGKLPDEQRYYYNRLPQNTGPRNDLTGYKLEYYILDILDKQQNDQRMFTVSIIAPGSRDLTSDIDTTVEVTCHQKVSMFALNLPKEFGELSLSEMDIELVIQAGMVYHFNQLNCEKLGQTSAESRDSNVYIDGFMHALAFPKFDDFVWQDEHQKEKSAIQLIKNKTKKEFYQAQKHQRNVLELAASLLPLRAYYQADDKEFTKQLKALFAVNSLDRSNQASFDKLMQEVIKQTNDLYQYQQAQIHTFKTDEAIRAQYVTRCSKSGIGLSPASLIHERAEDFEAYVNNVLYAKHIIDVAKVRQQLKEMAKVLSDEKNTLVSLQAELQKFDKSIHNGKKKIEQATDENDKEAFELKLTQDQTKRTNCYKDKFLPQIKTYVANLEAFTNLQIQQQEALINAQLFALEAYTNYSAPYHIVKWLQSGDDSVRIDRRRVALCSALQQMGFQLLHAQHYQALGMEPGQILYRVAKYGQRVADVFFGANQWFGDQEHAYHDSDKVLQRFKSEVLAKIFGEQLYDLLNLQIALVKEIKKNADIPVHEKGHQAMLLCLKRYMKEYKNSSVDGLSQKILDTVFAEEKDSLDDWLKVKDTVLIHTMGKLIVEAYRAKTHSYPETLDKYLCWGTLFKAMGSNQQKPQAAVGFNNTNKIDSNAGQQIKETTKKVSDLTGLAKPMTQEHSPEIELFSKEIKETQEAFELLITHEKLRTKVSEEFKQILNELEKAKSFILHANEKIHSEGKGLFNKSINNLNYLRATLEQGENYPIDQLNRVKSYLEDISNKVSPKIELHTYSITQMEEVKAQGLFFTQRYLNNALKDLSPFGKDFKELLEAIKATMGSNRYSCFISYAWPIDKNNGPDRFIQSFLETLRSHLLLAGFNALLDYKCIGAGESLEAYMKNLIICNHWLLIGTPSLTQKLDRNAYIKFEASMESIRKVEKLNDIYPMIPILAVGNAGQSLPWNKQGDKYLDLTQNSYLVGLKKLLQALSRIPEQIYNNLWASFEAKYPEHMQPLSQPLITKLMKDEEQRQQATEQVREEKLAEAYLQFK